MKTYTIKNSEAQNRPEQSGTAKQQNNAKHQANRKLHTQAVLDFLKAQLPQQYELAEIVGKWVWVEFSPARQSIVAKTLWSLGFHWNHRRGVWQHPCGMFNPYAPHPQDPRSKYGSYFAVNGKPA